MTLDTPRPQSPRCERSSGQQSRTLNANADPSAGRAVPILLGSHGSSADIIENRGLGINPRRL